MSKDPLDIALHFLKFRPRSVFEICQKLKSKNIDEAEIEKTIEVLKRNNLLDDAEFAKMYIRDRNRFKPSGSFVLRLELKKLGILEADIETATACQDEETLARDAIEAKAKYRNAEFSKQANFLKRRGFGTSVIYKVLKKE
jgi:regulatory protein